MYVCMYLLQDVERRGLWSWGKFSSVKADTDQLLVLAAVQRVCASACWRQQRSLPNVNDGDDSLPQKSLVVELHSELGSHLDDVAFCPVAAVSTAI